MTVDAGGHEAGTIHLYIGGRHVPVNIGAADTANEIHVLAILGGDQRQHFDLPW